jgi:ribonuclease VapC
MVIDTSALMAILNREPEGRAFRDAIKLAPNRLISAATRVEAGIVAVSRKANAGLEELNALTIAMKLDVVSVTDEHASLAIQAFQRFGKGRHPAGLNYGDCFSYALARATGEPLLFKGNDFIHTDAKQAYINPHPPTSA